jgi:glycerol kinase
MKEEHILALDLGTTGNRAIVFDKEQNIISKSYKEFTQIYPKPGWVEHDPEEIWRSACSVIKEAIEKVGIGSIKAIGITNQRETVVMWDKKTGKPIHNAIVWQDRRTAPLCKDMKDEGMEDAIHNKTGLFLDPYFSATKIKWLLDNVEGLREKAESGLVLCGTIDTWLLWKLTLGKVHATDYSNASRTMLFNLKLLDWDKGLCELFGVPMNILPRIMESSELFGYTDKSLFCREIPITGVAGDQQAAMFAQGCFEMGIVKNTYGTGLFLLMNTQDKMYLSNNLITTVAWKIKGEVDYAVEGSVFIGGAAVQWLRDGLRLFKDASETEAISNSVNSTEGVYFVPALVGLGAPYWDANARGMITGITRGTKSAHIVRAALEAICYQTRDVLEVMVNELNIKLKRLQADGGACQNNFIMQFQADILGILVERPKVIETTALGVAGMAGLAVGLWGSKEEFLSMRQIDREFHSNMAEEDREIYYSGWKNAIKKSLSK